MRIKQDLEFTKLRLAREKAKSEAWAEEHMAELRRNFPIEQYQRQNENTAQQKKEPDLTDLIAACTEGPDVVTGDDDYFNMFTVMNGFKQEALKLLKRPTNLDTNHEFLKLIEVTYTNVMQTVGHASIAEDDERVQLATARITEVNNALQKQRKQLEEQRDATRDTAPPPEPKAPTEETSTPKPPVSWWSRERGEEQSSRERIRQLLSRMQELNS